MLFYATYFSYAADAGVNRARALFPGIELSTIGDSTTIPNRPSADIATSQFTRQLDSSYEHLWKDGQHIPPIQKAIEGLSAYIVAVTGLSVTEFLEEQGISVKPTYAQLANIFGEEITEANIDDPLPSPISTARLPIVES
jgi:hypothetical protein